mmetsp:Transcript_109994/g.236771  ORF Transcript_109994/g.236771 Transcript_109994/m.236771 type:complete len:108 (+) Transcript_109994:478-801(+)
MDVKKMIDVLDKHLEGREWLLDEYSIADICVFPWVSCLGEKGYNNWELIVNGFGLVNQYSNVLNWLKRNIERPKTAKGLEVCKFTEPSCIGEDKGKKLVNDEDGSKL